MLKVGVIGGGQLARMMQPAAINLGIQLRVFAEAENSSAHLSATAIGDYLDPAALLAFAKEVDAITFDHEHVPKHLLEMLESEGVKVRPGSAALIHAQNKLVMRQKLASLGVPQPIWAAAKNAADIEGFIATNGPEIIVKTPIGGYDGKGVRVVSSVQEIQDWLDSISDFGGELLLEQKVPFVTELAQLSARRPSGEIKIWPLAKTVQVSGVCSEVIAPVIDIADRAKNIALSISEGLGVVGVMAVELFQVESGELFVNELAMRPHNSGHFTIEGSVTSQFEQHLRAVLDLPLGSTRMVAPFAAMLNLLGQDDSNTMQPNFTNAMELVPEAKFHLYEKAPRKGRKMGHITILGDEPNSILERANLARAAIYGN
jgi:5-(carboxyamino)imidazole ribonucleotide synthase